VNYKLSSDEEEFKRLIAEIRYLEGAAESIRSRINIINAVLAEFNMANRTLEGLEKEETDVPILVPIGGGSYIKAKLADPDKLIYGVGAGVALEKSFKEAREDISNRIAELDRTRRSLEQQLNQILLKAQENQNRLQELSVRLRRGAKRTDVRKAQRRT